MNSTIHALIVDDEAPGRDNIRLALGDHAHWRLVAECASVEEARHAIDAANVIDVVFLDVQMPRESGMVLARELAAKESPPIIVFVTAYQQYAVQAFEFHAIDYLLKPFDDGRFSQALKRVEELVALRTLGAPYGAVLQNYMDYALGRSTNNMGYIQSVCVRSVGQIECIAIRDVGHLVSSGNYVELHLASRVVLHRSTFSALWHRLDPKDFLRVHRCVVVRRSHCQGLRVVGDGAYELLLHNRQTVPVSERYVDDVRKLLLALAN